MELAVFLALIKKLEEINISKSYMGTNRVADHSFQRGRKLKCFLAVVEIVLKNRHIFQLMNLIYLNSGSGEAWKYQSAGKSL